MILVIIARDQNTSMKSILKIERF